MLDGIAEELAKDRPTDERAALALTLARAARARDRVLLARVAAESSGPEGLALHLASALGTLAPLAVERADGGYRYRRGGETLYVEDPVAAHFHAAGRWGPPLRPNPDRSPRLARGAPDALVREVLDGGVVVAPVRSEGMYLPALRILRAGITRDAALKSIVRWPDIAGFGRVGDRIAYEPRAGDPVLLGESPALGADGLLELLTRVRSGALSPHAPA